jgi:hypothetical protein
MAVKKLEKEEIVSSELLTSVTIKSKPNIEKRKDEKNITTPTHN